MKAYVVCKQGLYHPTKPNQVVPKLYIYMTGFENKTVDGSSLWCVCIVDDSIQIPAAANTDPDIFIFDTEAELATVLTTPRRNAVNTQLSATNWAINGVPIQAVSGDRVIDVLDKIRRAMGHNPEGWWDAPQMALLGL